MKITAKISTSSLLSNNAVQRVFIHKVLLCTNIYSKEKT